MFLRVLAFLIACAPVAAWPGPGQKTDLSGLTDAALLAMLDQVDQRLKQMRPVAIAGVPSGFAMPRGRLYAGLSLTNRRDRRYDTWDGSLSFGAGFGDPVSRLGAVLSVDVTSLSPFHFGASGKVGVSLHRELDVRSADWRLSLGLAGENLIRWGDSQVLSPEWTATATALWTPDDGPASVMVSAGLGSAIMRNSSKPGGFIGIGAGVSDTMALSLAWYGDEAIAALNYWPKLVKNTSITIGVGDLTNAVNGRRLILNLSWSPNWNWR